MEPERCMLCGSETGRAGPAEDSLYFKEDGPFCEECYSDRRCHNCLGEGDIEIMKNARGEVDYMSGSPSGEFDECDSCDGAGWQ